MLLLLSLFVYIHVNFDEDFQGYGPRVMVRSIKSIRNGEAVTIAYCDLLQPKVLQFYLIFVIFPS